MNRINTVLGAALLAGSLGVAVAADQAATPTNKADQTQVKPAREDLEPGAAPSIERMGENARCQHDGSGAAGGSKKQDAATGGQTLAKGAAEVAPASRDGTAIDTNNDNLFQPEDMEAALEEAGAQAKQKP